MALLTTKGVYGLSAMYHLSLSKNDKPIQLKEIAQKASIPQNYLVQLMVLLKQGGLVTSIRGAFGGYLLAKKADEILVSDIIIALEGTLQICDSSVKEPVLELFYQECNEKLQEMFSLSLLDFEQYNHHLVNHLNFSI